MQVLALAHNSQSLGFIFYFSLYNNIPHSTTSDGSFSSQQPSYYIHTNNFSKVVTFLKFKTLNIISINQSREDWHKTLALPTPLLTRNYEAYGILIPEQLFQLLFTSISHKYLFIFMPFQGSNFSGQWLFIFTFELKKKMYDTLEKKNTDFFYVLDQTIKCIVRFRFEDILSELLNW